VQVAYAIGRDHPVGFYLDCFGTEQVPVAQISDAVLATFDLRPAAITAVLNLKRPIYAATSAYGHFGRDLPEFTWEATDRADALARAVKG
jgi:S-adenosylmethionine synthetase